MESEQNSLCGRDTAVCFQRLGNVSLPKEQRAALLRLELSLSVSSTCARVQLQNQIQSARAELHTHKSDAASMRSVVNALQVAFGL